MRSSSALRAVNCWAPSLRCWTTTGPHEPITRTRDDAQELKRQTVDSYRTEEEQVEALKRWWRDNGRSTVIAVLLAAALGLGWQAWQRSREASAAEASLRYQALLEALDAQELAALDDSVQSDADPRARAEELRSGHGGSVYGKLAAMHLARLAVRDGDLEEAEKQLRWATDKAPAELAAVARLRLARVVASMGETDEALALLAEGADGELSAAYAQARGDVLLEAGRDDEALDAYREAAAGLAGTPVMPGSLRDKIEYLSPETPAAPVPAPATADSGAEAG